MRTSESVGVHELATEVGEPLTWLLHDAEQRMMTLGGLLTLWNRSLPTPRNRAARRAMRRLHDVVQSILAGRDGQTRGDVVDVVLEMRERGERSADDIVDHILTFLLAGHETTATTLTYAWQLLSRDVDCTRRLLDEVDQITGPIEPHHRPKLRFTDAVVREALRLYPAAWILERDAKEHDEIHGHPIPKKSIVAISPYVTHRLPRYWKDPERFNPDRFLDDNVPDGAYLPFGAGPRRCIGEWFASWEAVVFLATLAREFHVTPVGDFIPPTASTTLRPSAPVPMRIRTRH